MHPWFFVDLKVIPEFFWFAIPKDEVGLPRSEECTAPTKTGATFPDSFCLGLTTGELKCCESAYG